MKSIFTLAALSPSANLYTRCLNDAARVVCLRVTNQVKRIFSLDLLFLGDRMNNQKRRIVQELRRLEDELPHAHSPVRVRRLLERLQDLRLQLREMEDRERREPLADLQQIAGEMTTNLLVRIILFGVLRNAIEGKPTRTLSVEEEQQRVDAIAAELLADVDIHF